MKKIKYINGDDYSNIYVVGDIHGEYAQLKDELKKIGFNYNTDLLIAVGDLVDRGKENELCVDLLKESWFTSVKGNHEDFCVKGVDDENIAFYHKMTNNGGEWFYSWSKPVQKGLAEIFSGLPILLEAKYKGKKFGFVHADVPVEDWELLKEMLEQGDSLGDRTIEDSCLWSRGVIDKYQNYGYEPIIAQIGNVFLGHTVLPEVIQVGNCTFLDTGGVFQKSDNTYKLSIVNLSDYV